MIQLSETITINWEKRKHPAVHNSWQGVLYFVNGVRALRVETIPLKSEEVDPVCQKIADVMKKEYYSKFNT